MQRHAPAFTDFLEIGCGTGYVLQGIAAAFPQARLCATEAQTEGLQFAAARVPRATFLQMDARRMPFDREFDAIGAFDVIEHIAEDEAVLTQAHRALRPGANLYLFTTSAGQGLAGNVGLAPLEIADRRLVRGVVAAARFGLAGAVADAGSPAGLAGRAPRGLKPAIGSTPAAW